MIDMVLVVVGFGTLLGLAVTLIVSVVAMCEVVEMGGPTRRKRRIQRKYRRNPYYDRRFDRLEERVWLLEVRVCGEHERKRVSDTRRGNEDG